ncbi:MAG TPA: type II secretion system protein [Fibrobacteria bacterium]|nr:type II secretion system protein [Fibrobacteria bacterium]
MSHQDRTSGWFPRSGFSMPEIFAVIAIIGIVSAMAVPRFMKFIHVSRMESAALILGKDMEWVKLAATRSGTKHYIRFFTGSDSSSYEVWKEASDPVDNRFNSGEDSLLKRVVLETPVRIGGLDPSIPAAPIAPQGIMPANGMGVGYVDETCRDDGVVAGQGSWDNLVAFCGGSTAQTEAGALYLSLRNYPEYSEAIVYDGRTSFRLMHYGWRGGSWIAE